MKKFLSFILVLAMVLSCVSMVTFASDEAENQGTSTFHAAKFAETSLNATSYMCNWQANYLVDANKVTDDLDGTLSYSYTIYNTGTENIQVNLLFNTTEYKVDGEIRAEGGKGASATLSTGNTGTITIKPNESADLNISIEVTNGWVNLVQSDSATWSLPVNYLTIRLNLPAVGGATQPREFIIVDNGHSEMAKDYLIDTYTHAKWTKTTPTEDDIKIHGVDLTVTDPTHTNVGLLMAHTAADAYLADDATFTGKLSITYTVYNLSEHTLKFSIAHTYAGGWTQFGTKIYTIPAGQYANVTSFVNITDGIYTYTSTGATYTLSQLRIRMDAKFTDAAIGDRCIITPYAADPDTYLLDATLGIYGATATRTLGEKFTDEIASCTKFVDTVTNGDAEAGTTCWTKFNSASIAQDDDPLDNTNKVIKTTITGKYGSVNYNLAAAIINNPKYNMYGGGVGTYKITFRILAEAGHSGKWGLSAAQDSNQNLKANGFDNSSATAVDNEWTTVTTHITVTEAIHQALVDNLYNTYYLRLDGSGTGSAYASGTYFAYYMDDVTIEKAVLPTAMEIVNEPTKTDYLTGEEFDSTGLKIKVTYDNGTSEELTTGFTVSGFDSATEGPKTVTVSYKGLTDTFEVTVTEPKAIAVKIVSDGAGRYNTKTGIWADEANFTGAKYVSYTIYNPSENDIIVGISLQVTHDGGWYGPAEADSEDYVIQAKSKITVVKHVNFTNGVAEVTKTTTGTYSPSKFFARFEFRTFAANDVIYIQDSREDVTYLYNTSQPIGISSEAYEIPSYDMLSGVQITMLKDSASGNRYLRSADLKLTKDDVTVDGDELYILLQYRVYNLNNRTIAVSVMAQNGSNGWSGIAGVSYPGNQSSASYEQAIPAYSSVVYTIKIPVNADYTITSGTSTYALSKTSLRFQCESNSGTLPQRELYAGDKFYMQALNEASLCFFRVADTEYFDVESKVYGTKDYNKIAGAQLQIGSSFALNYTTMVEHGVSDIQLKVTRGDYTVYLKPTTISNGQALFNYKGINAQCLADTIDTELICDGKTVAIKEGYSVKQYALNQYANGSAELKQLLNDMLVYGATAQDYMDYKEDNLATTGVEWISTTTLDVEALDVVKDVTNNYDKAITSAGLNISYVNKIYFRVDETKVDLTKIWVTKNNGEAVAFSIDGNVIYTDAIKANGFGDVYTINVTHTDGTVATVQYNVNAYIANKYNSSTVGAITTALGNYGVAAVAYQNSLEA